MRARDIFTYRPARWPAVAGAIAFGSGLLMLAGATWGFMHAGRTAAKSAVQVSQVSAPATAPRESESLIVAPPSALYLTHVRSIFKLASERRLSLGGVEYQAEMNRPAGVLLRHVVLHVEDEYPKLKSFIAELLRAMPHVQLDEIQIEQATAQQPASRISASIKLSLIYQADETESVRKGADTGS